MDEKWKLNKRGSCSRREHTSSSSSSKRSSSDQIAYLKRCSSMPDSVKSSRSRHPTSSSSSSNVSNSSSAAGASTSSSSNSNSNSGSSPRSFSTRCSNLVKEQRAKFYIMRRCVNMLICWRDNYP